MRIWARMAVEVASSNLGKGHGRLMHPWLLAMTANRYFSSYWLGDYTRSYGDCHSNQDALPSRLVACLQVPIISRSSP